MKVFAFDQRSEEWHHARLGIPTASEFHRILCAKLGTGYRCPACKEEFDRKRKKCACGGEVEPFAVPRPSTQAGAYMNRLLAEWYFGHPLEDPQSQYQSQWMERGEILEDEAVRAYEFDSGNTTTKVGFVTLDSGLIGCSPDRFVGDSGGLEIKCSSPQVHMGYMLNRCVDEDHFPQVQGNMLLCERKWWDVVSYSPPFPTVVIRCPRDEEYIGRLSDALQDFVRKLLGARQLIEKQYGLLSRDEAATVDTLGVSDADLDAILASRIKFSCG